MDGRVIVTNNTGHIIRAGDTCGGQGLFDVGLGNDKIEPQVSAHPFCAGPAFMVPIGESTWYVGVFASYAACDDIPRCVNGTPPPLPPGDYRAVVFAWGVLIPPPLVVHVTPKVPAVQRP